MAFTHIKNRLFYIFLLFIVLTANQLIIFSDEIIGALCFFIIVQFALSHHVVIGGDNVFQNMIDDARQLKKNELQKSLVNTQEIGYLPMIEKLNNYVSGSVEVNVAHKQSSLRLNRIPETKKQLLNALPKKQLNFLFSLLGSLSRETAANSVKSREVFVYFVKDHLIDLGGDKIAPALSSKR